MPLAPGARVGSYEVLGPLGVGGMGEVYRARDARLKRDVAIKVLPESFAQDADRLARFQREAEVLAALNHPSIGAIYGFEDRALILELVDGETLADLVTRGPVPIPEALSIARQICDALDAAHEQGIVHRDLKPANIKVRRDGSIKVLDFGLAKAAESAGGGPDTPLSAHDSSADDSLSVTRAADVSRGGVIVGTAAYMSPEQARGKPVDKRSDIWAFGCVLYEMLTGRRAFAGQDLQDTLSRVLQHEPDFSVLPAETPPAIQRLLARCLEKDRAKRLPQIAVAAFQIDEARSRASASELPSIERPHRFTGFAISTLAAGVVVGAMAAWLIVRPAPAPPAPVTRLQIAVTPAQELGGIEGRPTRTAFAISPDGRTLVFAAMQEGQASLYIRPLSEPTATVVEGTRGAVNPFFSPDGAWVGYWAAGQIRKVPLAGGPPVVVTSAQNVFGATWTDDDRIVFARGSGSLLDIAAGGGEARELTTISSERSEVSHRLPHAIPGTDAVLYTVTKDRFPRWDETEIWLVSRGTGATKKLIDGGADARYVPGGHLMYVREGAPLVVPFDLNRLEVTGGPVGVLPDVMHAAYISGQPNDTGAMQASLSSNGTLVYIPGGMPSPQAYDVMMLDRAGKGDPLPIQPQDFRTIRRSPDGTRLAISTVGRERGTWLYGFERGTFSRLAGAGRSTGPAWTPDGERITYAASANGPNNVHWIRADGGGSSELLVASPRNIEVGGWAPNERDLFYYEVPSDGGPNAQRGPSLFVKDVPAKAEPRQLVAGVGGLGGVDVSPDGRWIAYQSNESGQLEAWVEAYPGPGPRYQVSTNGGGAPIWVRDGRELIYARGSGQRIPGRVGPAEVDIMSVAVTPGASLAFGQPRLLFSGSYSMNSPARGYDVSADGQRFYMLQLRQRAPEVLTQIQIIQHWAAALDSAAPRP